MKNETASATETTTPIFADATLKAGDQIGIRYALQVKRATVLRITDNERAVVELDGSGQKDVIYFYKNNIFNGVRGNWRRAGSTAERGQIDGIVYNGWAPVPVLA